MHNGTVDQCTADAIDQKEKQQIQIRIVWTLPPDRARRHRGAVLEIEQLPTTGQNDAWSNGGGTGFSENRL
ncbi:MAG: hypothetical protein Kow0063_44840 [Anaerolineae bacterium]